jgi:hypothetical protein
MTDRVVSFDMNVVRAPGPAPRSAAPETGAHAPAETARRADMVQETVSTAVVFAALAGSPVAASDLTEKLTLLAGSGPIEADHVARALHDSGFACQVRAVGRTGLHGLHLG